MSAFSIVLMIIAGALLARLIRIAQLIGSYRIHVVPSASATPEPQYFIYEALGPWPMVNWSIAPSAMFTDKRAAEHWIAEAMAIKAGKRSQ